MLLRANAPRHHLLSDVNAPDSSADRALVAVGGGTGLAVLLRGLKHHVGHHREHLTAVVTVADDGGSSGRLRREFGILPPGDIRNCIVALASDETLLARLFQYRFPNGGGLAGHSFGNLFLTALTGVTGDFYKAISASEEILAVRGRILPSTLNDVRLRAAGRSGKIYEGESAIGRCGEPLTSVEIEPAHVPAFHPAIEALERADVILLGPGSLYTSVLPNLLIPGIRNAIAKSRGKVVLILNLMSQPGETDHMHGHDYLDAIAQHAGADLVDCVLVNSTPPAPQILEHYRLSESELVGMDRDAVLRHGVELVENDLLAPGQLIRHDPDKLSRAILAIATPLSA